jgi:hypothetical protein
MSLLGLLVVLFAFVIYCALVALAQRHLGDVPGWVFRLAYILGAIVLIVYLGRAMGLFDLLSSVRV